MICFFSGGSAIVEVFGDDPAVMLSYYSNVYLKKGVPDTRTLRILNTRTARRKAKAVLKKKKGKGG